MNNTTLSNLQSEEVPDLAKNKIFFIQLEHEGITETLYNGMYEFIDSPGNKVEMYMKQLSWDKVLVGVYTLDGKCIMNSSLVASSFNSYSYAGKELLQNICEMLKLL